MIQWNRSFGSAVVAISAVIAVLVTVSVRAQEGRIIHVSGVDDLYAAVNDPDNAGGRIVLAPGTYVLDPTQANAGRLEFQENMEVVGRRGDAEAVVIDASNLPRASYTIGPFITGAVRMGRGSNALEWLTIQNAVNGAAALETDLPPAQRLTAVRVAHIIAQRNVRGIDLRNLGTAFNGHVLRGILEDNITRDNTQMGIRVINTQGVTGATVWAILRRNHSYGNTTGLQTAHDNSSGNVILIDSRADRFTKNVIGCNLYTGVGLVGVADSNVMVFEAHGDTIEQNDVPPDPSLSCQNQGVGVGCQSALGGVVAWGAWTNAALPNQASGNLLHLAIIDTTFNGNQDSDVHAFGAQSSSAAFPGTDNHVDLLLQGVSRQAALSIVDSDPPDPNGTNTVVVLHHGRH